jgi:hypothetical protein
MLQEGLEREREQLEKERETAIQHSQEAQDRFRQEVELAIAGWKCAMNAEVAKAKVVCEELEEEKKRVSCKLEHLSLRHQVQSDMDFYTSRINCQEQKVSFFKCTTTSNHKLGCECCGFSCWNNTRATVTKKMHLITDDKSLP